MGLFWLQRPGAQLCAPAPRVPLLMYRPLQVDLTPCLTDCVTLDVFLHLSQFQWLVYKMGVTMPTSRGCLQDEVE